MDPPVKMTSSMSFVPETPSASLVARSTISKFLLNQHFEFCACSSSIQVGVFGNAWNINIHGLTGR